MPYCSSCTSSLEGAVAAFLRCRICLSSHFPSLFRPMVSAAELMENRQPMLCPAAPSRLPGAISPALRSLLHTSLKRRPKLLAGLDQRQARCVQCLLASSRPASCTRASASAIVFSRLSPTCCSFLLAPGHLRWGRDPAMQCLGSS